MMYSTEPSHAPLYQLEDSVVVGPVVRDIGSTMPGGTLTGPRGVESISDGEYEMLTHVLDQIRRGHAVQIVTYEKDLTTQQAADILNISRQHLVTLLERDELPFHCAGTHRRIALEDVLTYRRHRSAKRRSALAAIAQEEVTQGTY